MEEILLKDVMPYIQIWTSIIIAFLLSVLYYLLRLKRQHPEIFWSDTTAESQCQLEEKAELRRHYNNMTIFGISSTFIWMIGLVLICSKFSSFNQGWLVLIFSICVFLSVLPLIQRKPKK